MSGASNSRPQGAAAADPGGVRTQLCHIIDLAPTVLDVCGVTAPDVVDGVTQLPIDGPP